jgi:F-box interacting protein
MGFEYWFGVWNPATRTSSKKIGYFHDRDTFCFAFGCDNSTGAYKVVAFCYRETTSDVRVLNLGGDHVWRNIESFPVVVLGHKHVYFSGTMNWLATVEHSLIVSLDLETETYNQYTVPRGVDEGLPNSPTIGVLGGCLCFSYSHRGQGR